MKRIILVTGMPRQGKTHLTNRLVTEFSFAALSVDQAYLDFVKTRCPMLYFEALHLYIGPHYDAIIENGDDYSNAHLGRGFDAEWRRYLATRIRGMASLHDNLAVEGYLLKCCDSQFDQMLASVGPLFRVSTEGGRYYFQGRELSAGMIAALGT